MEKALSRDEVRRRAAQFSYDWRDARYERGESQSFWNSFFHVFGIDRRRVNAYFEFAAKRSSTGRIGFIDCFWPGTILVEQKSVDKNLDEAEFQALDYLPDLPPSQFPRALIMSDFRRIRILRLDRDHSESYTFDTSRLDLEIDRFDFMTNQRDLRLEEEEKANMEAVQLMTSLYVQLEASNYVGHNASIFMVRLLFLLFGDDTGLWQRGAFERFLAERTSEDGSDCGSQITQLFQVLNEAPGKRSNNLESALRVFPYVNGGLFEETIPIPAFSPAMRKALMECCHFNWAEISPAIFGSMFQAIKDPKERRKGGEFYTSERNILRTIGPLFLDELRDKLYACGDNLAQVRALHNSLAKLRYMDPACGCGNFLVVAYREMRDLELEVLRKIRDLTGQDVLDIDITQSLKVSPMQFVGIELEEWPSRIAETAFFMTDHQANTRLALEFGKAPDRLPISISAKIVSMTNAIFADWRDFVEPTEDVLIFGNPPFGGRGTRTAQQTQDMKSYLGDDYNINLDYVTCWYRKALDFYGEVSGRWAFVSTSSVSQGEPVAYLWKHILEAGWRCRFAHKSFVWVSEATGAAGVHVSILGFDRAKTSPKPVLWVYPENGRGEPEATEASRINPYLLDGPNILIETHRDPLCADLPPAAFGSMANDGGNFFIETENEYDEVMLDPIAAKYVRPFIGAAELLNGEKRWCFWMEELEPGDLQRSPLLAGRVEAVNKHRKSSKSPTTSKTRVLPYLFAQRAQPKTSYLAVPRHSKVDRLYCPVARFDANVICGDHNFLIPDPEGFAFAVLSSSMFWAWMRGFAGRLRADPRFSKTFAYNSFPLASPKASQKRIVLDAAAGVAEARSKYPSNWIGLRSRAT